MFPVVVAIVWQQKQKQQVAQNKPTSDYCDHGVGVWEKLLETLS